jgi:hypothetical protein
MNSFVDYPYGYQTASEACSLGGNTGYAFTVYYTGSLGNGTSLYFNVGLTEAFDADGSYGYYWIAGYSFSYGGVISNYTACPSAVNVNVNSVFSLDVDINDVTVDGVSVTYVGGQNFPIQGGGGSGTFQTTLTGTRTIIVYYGSSIPGQNIVIIDSDSNSTCQNVSGNGSDTFTVFGAAINSNGDVSITATDGLCS